MTIGLVCESLLVNALISSIISFNTKGSVSVDYYLQNKLLLWFITDCNQ